MFTKLKYLGSPMKPTISHFITSLRSENSEAQSTSKNTVHRVVLPFKDQKSAVSSSALSNNIDHTLQPVLKSRKICEDLEKCESEPTIICHQCVVYNYKCDLCDAEYVAYTSRHLHHCIDEHRYSAIGKH